MTTLMACEFGLLFLGGFPILRGALFPTLAPRTTHVEAVEPPADRSIMVRSGPVHRRGSEDHDVTGAHRRFEDIGMIVQVRRRVGPQVCELRLALVGPLQEVQAAVVFAVSSRAIQVTAPSMASECGCTS